MRCLGGPLLCLLLGLAACSSSTPAQTAALPLSGPVAEVIVRQHLLQDGDLVFRRGRDVMSEMVLSRQAGSRFSHVGMVVTDGQDRRVIHAMPDEPGQPGGVREETLVDFLAPTVAGDAAVYRVSALDDTVRQRLHTYLLAQRGKPFDYDFAQSTPERLYCSELVISVLEQAGLTLAPATVRLPLVAEPVILPDALHRLPGLIQVAGE